MWYFVLIWITFCKYKLTLYENKVTMRYFSLFLLIIALLGCQSDSALVVPPVAVPTHSAPIAASPSPVFATVTRPSPTPTTEIPTSTQIVTQTAEPLATATQEPQPVNPVLPSPTVLASAYPVERSAGPVEPIWRYLVIEQYPHDTSAYTQGLVVEDWQYVDGCAVLKVPGFPLHQMMVFETP